MVRLRSTAVLTLFVLLAILVPPAFQPLLVTQTFLLCLSFGQL